MSDLPAIELPIATARLNLRNYTDADAATVAATVAAPAYWQAQAVEPPTATQITALVTWAAAEARVKPRLNYFLAATLKDTGAIVGEAVLKLVNPVLGIAEIGFGVAAPYWRLGYGVEIARAMRDAAFHQLKAHRVAAQCTPENVGSIRVMERIGLAREGLLRDVTFARGRWWSTVVYAAVAGNGAAPH